MAKTNIKSRRVRAWMVLHGVTPKGVAAEVGVTKQMVSLFLNGLRGSPRLCAYYAEKGCPEKYLPTPNRKSSSK